MCPWMNKKGLDVTWQSSESGIMTTENPQIYYGLEASKQTTNIYPVHNCVSHVI